MGEPTSISIRPVQPEDVPVLRALYEAAARVIGPQAYGPQQVQAWASFAREDGMVDFILRPQTFVAERDGRIVGFAGLSPDGLIHSLFVHPDFARRGIGSRLLRHLIDLAGELRITRLWTHASHFSRGTFQKQGFEVVEIEQAERGGVVFKRFLMKRDGETVLGAVDRIPLNATHKPMAPEGLHGGRFPVHDLASDRHDRSPPGTLAGAAHAAVSGGESGRGNNPAAGSLDWMKRLDCARRGDEESCPAESLLLHW